MNITLYEPFRTYTDQLLFFSFFNLPYNLIIPSCCNKRTDAIRCNPIDKSLAPRQSNTNRVLMQ